MNNEIAYKDIVEIVGPAFVGLVLMLIYMLV